MNLDMWTWTEEASCMFCDADVTGKTTAMVGPFCDPICDDCRAEHYNEDGTLKK